MQIKWVLVTPEMAREMLQKNVNNRSIRVARVMMYANDMKAGKWRDNPQPIMISESGTITDGQHRLHAVIESGCTVNTAIVYGVPINIRPVVDQGVSRKPGDVLGWQHPSWSNRNLRCAYALRMWQGIMLDHSTWEQIMGDKRRTKPALSVQDRVDLVVKYRPSLDFIFEQFSTPIVFITVSEVMAVIGRAFRQKNCDAKRLTEFCEILRTGMATSSDDKIAIQLRNYLLQRGSVRRAKQEGFFRTQYALKLFMAREQSAQLREERSDVFPIEPCYRLADAEEKIKKEIESQIAEVKTGKKKRKYTRRVV
jgi:hypothetical protein